MWVNKWVVVKEGHGEWHPKGSKTTDNKATQDRQKTYISMKTNDNTILSKAIVIVLGFGNKRMIELF
jgi:hypothetical protein